MELIGMRKPAITEPEFLIESLGVHDESVAFPFAHRPAVIKRVIRIAAKLALLSPTVGVDDPVIAIAATDQYKNALPIPILVELKPVGQLVLTRAARRHAVEVHRDGKSVV